MADEDRRSIRRLLAKHDACAEAIKWAADKDRLQELWDQCEVPEWLLWSLEQLDYRNDAKLRSFATACARRHAGLVDGEKLLRLLTIADAVAAKDAPPTALLEAWNDGRAAAEEAACGADWSAGRAAAINAVCETVRVDSMEAAKGASTNGQRAVAWQVGTPESISTEAQWQANALRRILDEDVRSILGRARDAMIDE